jgi:hypothetical protein
MHTVQLKSICRGCGRPLLYGWLEMCRQCDIHTDNYVRREFRRNVNECKSQDSEGEICMILQVTKQARIEKKRMFSCYLSAISASEASSRRLPAHPQNHTDFALRILGFTIWLKPET